MTKLETVEIAFISSFNHSFVSFELRHSDFVILGSAPSISTMVWQG
jgi:hypothetical protein